MANALIFGGSGALGESIARRCVREGVEVLRAARHPAADSGQEWLSVDICDDVSLAKAAGAVPDLNLVVFAQGVRPDASLSEMTRRHAQSMFDTHVIGTLLAIHYLLPRLAHNSSVILIASSAARKGSYDPSYAAAKGAIVSLTRTLAKELKSRVRVNCVSPGLVENSPVHRSMTAAQADKHVSRMYAQRLVQADDVASVVWELYRNYSLSGSIVTVDAGYSE